MQCMLAEKFNQKIKEKKEKENSFAAVWFLKDFY